MTTAKSSRLLIDPINRRDSIPASLAEAVSILDSSDRVSDIDVVGPAGFNVVFCGPMCLWHDDADMLDFSALLVVRNDAECYVQVRGGKTSGGRMNQPVGTLLVLDVRREHRLWNPQGEAAPESACWAAVNVDYYLENGRRKADLEFLSSNERGTGRIPTIDEAWRDMEYYLRHKMLPEWEDRRP